VPGSLDAVVFAKFVEAFLAAIKIEDTEAHLGAPEAGDAAVLCRSDAHVADIDAINKPENDDPRSSNRSNWQRMRLDGVLKDKLLLRRDPMRLQPLLPASLSAPLRP
jgi:hypothetical protein